MFDMWKGWCHTLKMRQFCFLKIPLVKFISYMYISFMQKKIYVYMALTVEERVHCIETH